MKLFDYQKEIIESDEDKIIMNWARCNGKTWTIANLIKEKRPKEVLWANFFNGVQLNNLQDKFNDLLNIDEEFKNSIESYKLTKKEIYLKYKDGFYTRIRQLREYEIREYVLHSNGAIKHVDYIIFDDCHPFDTGYKADKTICTLTENNYDKHLQHKFPDFYISETDYRFALKNNLITKDIVERLKEKGKEKFLKEFAILDSLYDMNTPNLELFATKAIRELIYEYEKIPNASNTILTRKNIIEMIKDLDQLRKQN